MDWKLFIFIFFGLAFVSKEWQDYKDKQEERHEDLMRKLNKEDDKDDDNYLYP